MSQALYYPSIEFADIDALKRSLLVWDRVNRIVPKEYLPNDSPEIETAVQSGAVLNLAVDENDRAKAAHRFLEFYGLRRNFKSRLTWPAGLDSRSFNRINVDLLADLTLSI